MKPILDTFILLLVISAILAAIHTIYLLIA